jgi:formylglycine-generating enzyme
MSRTFLFLVAFVSLANSLFSQDREKTPERNQGQELTNSIGMRFTLISPGDFRMGARQGEPARNDEDLHSVKITKAFYMAVYEVTVGEFRRFAEGNSRMVSGKTVPFQTRAERGGQSFQGGRPGGFQLTNSDLDTWVTTASWKTPGWVQNDNYPTAFISWEDAQAFVQWLSKKEGKSYRLPTEAEWEYACRAGTSTSYWWGDLPDETGKVANVADRAFKKRFPSITDTMDMDDGYIFMSPVGRYRPNPFGLYDMVGNAWEWVSDFYVPHLKDGVDPRGPANGSEHVARGGGYGTTADRCRCAARFHDPPDTRYSGTGFRVVLDIEKTQGENK